MPVLPPAPVHVPGTGIKPLPAGASFSMTMGGSGSNYTVARGGTPGTFEGDWAIEFRIGSGKQFNLSITFDLTGDTVKTGTMNQAGTEDGIPVDRSGVVHIDTAAKTLTMTVAENPDLTEDTIMRYEFFGDSLIFSFGPGLPGDVIMVRK